MNSSASFQSLLCGVCLIFLTGHWEQRPVENGPPDAYHWVQVQDGKAIEPLHHDIRSLRVSMQTGCPLCGLIFGLFDPAEAIGLEARESFSRSKGQMAYRLEPWHPDIKAHMVYLSSHSQYFFELTFSQYMGGPVQPYQGYIPRNTFSTESLNQVKKWLTECDETHSLCGLSSKMALGGTRLPTRLIDIGTPDNPICRLVVGNTIDRHSGYFTLSHCWGGKPLLCLTTKNLEDFLKNIWLDLMPKTFREAIYVTRSLGVQYIWIDALCIIQDLAKDWEDESLLMSQVYSNAGLNIAATASSDGTQGLFREWDPRIAGACVVQPSWTGIGNLQPKYVCCDTNVWEDNVTYAPLQKRCWVLQERLLSPRIIHFAKGQIFWECPSLVASESMPIGLPASIRDSQKSWEASIQHRDMDLNRLLLSNQWLEMVQSYCRGKLSFGTDKLVAISGLAKRMIYHWDGGPTDFVAGLVRENLPHQLLWRVDMNCEAKVADVYRAPSWSWASLDAEILIPSLSQPNLVITVCKQLMEMHEIEVQPENTLLSCSSGCLRLQGPICKIKRVVFIEKTEHPHPDGGFRELWRTEWQLEGDQLVPFPAYLDFGIWRDPEKIPEKEYYFLGFFDTSLEYPKSRRLVGLILERNKAVDGQYRRAGTFDCDQKIAMERIYTSFNAQVLEKQDYNIRHDDATYTIEVV